MLKCLTKKKEGGGIDIGLLFSSPNDTINTKSIIYLSLIFSHKNKEKKSQEKKYPFKWNKLNFMKYSLKCLL